MSLRDAVATWIAARAYGAPDKVLAAERELLRAYQEADSIPSEMSTTNAAPQPVTSPDVTSRVPSGPAVAAPSTPDKLQQGVKRLASDLQEALLHAATSNIDPTDYVRIGERHRWLIEEALNNAVSLGSTQSATNAKVPTLEQVADHMRAYFNERADQWRKAAKDWQDKGDMEQAERHRTMGAWFSNQSMLVPSEILSLYVGEKK